MNHQDEGRGPPHGKIIEDNRERSNSINSESTLNSLQNSEELLLHGDGKAAKKIHSNNDSINEHLDNETLKSYEEYENSNQTTHGMKQEEYQLHPPHHQKWESPGRHTPQTLYTQQHSKASTKSRLNEYSRFSTPYANQYPFVTPGVMSIPTFTPKKMYQISPSKHIDSIPSSGPSNIIEFDLPESQRNSTTPKNLNQVLKAHQIASITLCSVFGTGLLIKTAATLKTCGPLPLLISLIFMSGLSYQVICALCEMCTYIPLPNAYSGYTERFVDPALGYTLGYFYLFQYLIIGPNQIFVGAMTVQYWISPDSVNPAVWITIFVLILTLLNYIDVGKIALTADIFVLLKMAVYLFIFIMLLVVISGGGAKKEVIGFKYWSSPGPINNHTYTSSSPAGDIVAFLSAITSSIFPFTGVESFCVTVGEAYYPRKTIPKAKNILFFCVVIAYLPIAFLLGLAVAYNDPKFPSVVANQDKTTAASSAIILAITNAGLKVFPPILNGVIFIFVLSAANSSFYISTRILYGLSASGLAPAIFSRTAGKGVPLFAISLVSVFNLLAYLGVTEPTRKLFELFSNSVCGFTLILWMCILITHICFLRAMKIQDADRTNVTYRAKGGVIASGIAFFLCTLLVLFREFVVFLDVEHFDIKLFLTGYICIPVFLCVFLGFKFYYKTSFIKPEKADLYFYKDCVDASEEAYINKELENYKGESKYSIKLLYQKFFV